MITRKCDRSYSIQAPENTVDTPFFFPAISSIKTNLKPLEYLKLISMVGYSGFLISSYDIYKADQKDKKAIFATLSECRGNGTLILLDSGNYEAYWNQDKRWSISNLKSVLGQLSVDFCLSFDCFWFNSQRADQYVKETLRLVSKTAGMQKTGLTIPIIHSDPAHFPTIVKKVVKAINPEIIAVPERELGLGIFDRSKTIKRIRTELDKTKQNIALHLLGTGNPISILIYTTLGADMFDGLEWCKTVVNPATGHLLHFVQKDLFQCSCLACKDKRTPYHAKTMVHNLIFYANFMQRIKEGIKKNQLGKLLNEYLPEKSASRVKEIAELK